MSQMNILRRMWNSLLDMLIADEPVARALSMYRLQDQLWVALNPDDDGEWKWPIDVFVDGPDLFAIYTQGGLLYRVGLTVNGDTLALGTPVQVTQEFPAVEQSRGRFIVQRQTDGRDRWTMIAGTSVLNRVAEIDSAELFDSFVDEAACTGKYPRLDFYHLGMSDPEAWEFGTADYLARDGVCYIASGTFDNHPLAAATIAAAAREPGRWGASIEFRARQEPELIAVEPAEVTVPVYRKGTNTRISIVLEQDAAGHFTTLGVSREVLRMRSDILEKLTELYGDDEQAQAFLAQFGVEVDRVNRQVDEQGLIHRTQEEQPAAEAAASAGAQEEQEEDAQTPGELVLDEEAVRAIVGEVVQTPVFTTMHTAINTLAENVTALTAALEAREQKIADLEGQLARMTKRVKALEQEEGQKQQQWLEDLPASRQTKVTFRPRQARQGRDGDNADGGNEDPESLADLAERALAELPNY